MTSSKKYKWENFFCKELLQYFVPRKLKGPQYMPGSKQISQTLKDLLKLKNGALVMEVGILNSGVAMCLSKVYQVVAFEPISLLVEDANNLAAKWNVQNVRFLNQKIGKFNFPEYFDGGYCISGLLTYLSDYHRDRLFNNIRKLLKNNAVFIIDIPNKDRIVKCFVPRLWDRLDKDLNELVLQENKLTLENRTLCSTWYYFKRNHLVKRTKINQRLFSHDEMIAFLERKGFKILTIYGSWWMKDYTEHSHRLIIVAQKISDR